MGRVILLFVLALALAVYVRPLRDDWRRGAVMAACVWAGAFIGAVVARPLQQVVPNIDALTLCGTVGVLAGIFGGRFLALRVAARR